MLVFQQVRGCIMQSESNHVSQYSCLRTMNYDLFVLNPLEIWVINFLISENIIKFNILHVVLHCISNDPTCMAVIYQNHIFLDFLLLYAAWFAHSHSVFKLTNKRIQKRL